ncbi:MAG: hypothetical protein NC489_17970 [Ruminococcus flavefaciens]|nr:hypothetical protein [Ruminococcus flavefaciens]
MNLYLGIGIVYFILTALTSIAEGRYKKVSFIIADVVLCIFLWPIMLGVMIITIFKKGD